MNTALPNKHLCQFDARADSVSSLQRLAVLSAIQRKQWVFWAVAAIVAEVSLHRQEISP